MDVQKNQQNDFDIWWSQQVKDASSHANRDVKKLCSIRQGDLMLMCLKAYIAGRIDESKKMFITYGIRGEQKDD